MQKNSTQLALLAMNTYLIAMSNLLSSKRLELHSPQATGMCSQFTNLQPYIGRIEAVLFKQGT